MFLRAIAADDTEALLNAAVSENRSMDGFYFDIDPYSSVDELQHFSQHWDTLVSKVRMKP